MTSCTNRPFSSSTPLIVLGRGGRTARAGRARRGRRGCRARTRCRGTVACSRSRFEGRPFASRLPAGGSVRCLGDRHRPTARIGEARSDATRRRGGARSRGADRRVPWLDCREARDPRRADLPLGRPSRRGRARDGGAAHRGPRRRRGDLVVPRRSRARPRLARRHSAVDAGVELGGPADSWMVGAAPRERDSGAPLGCAIRGRHARHG